MYIVEHLPLDPLSLLFKKAVKPVGDRSTNNIIVLTEYWFLDISLFALCNNILWIIPTINYHPYTVCCDRSGHVVTRRSGLTWQNYGTLFVSQKHRRISHGTKIMHDELWFKGLHRSRSFCEIQQKKPLKKSQNNKIINAAGSF